MADNQEETNEFPESPPESDSEPESESESSVSDSEADGNREENNQRVLINIVPHQDHSLMYHVNQFNQGLEQFLRTYVQDLFQRDRAILEQLMQPEEPVNNEFPNSPIENQQLQRADFSQQTFDPCNCGAHSPGDHYPLGDY